MFCQVKDISIYYEIIGKGIPILMLHGFYPDHRLMKGCMEPILADQPGWKRIYIDLPGMGQTKGQAWLNSTDKMLEVVLDFVDQIIPGQPFLVVGESYGGYLARGLVYLRPVSVKGICLICPLIIPEIESRNLPPKRILLHNQNLIEKLSESDASEFESIAVVQSQLHWDRFKSEVLSGVNSADGEYLEILRKTGYAFSFPVDHPDQLFDKPALILLGRQDTSVGYRDAWEIIENFPRATFAVLDRAGHDLQIEADNTFSALVSDWLERVMITE
jgi:pimeloyl-ACP methyl ester carboxylesterase